MDFLFAPNISYPMEMNYPAQSWKDFRRMNIAPKIPVRYLEARIARYCKALSACGIITNSSCDGNHEGKEKLYFVFQEPRYLEWHSFLWDNVLGKLFKIEWNHNKTSICFNKQKQEDVYLQLNNG